MGRGRGHRRVSQAKLAADLKMAQASLSRRLTGEVPFDIDELATANDNTGDLRAVQSFAGHAKPETTSLYTRANARRLAAVVASIDY